MWQTSYLLLAVASYGIIHTDAAPLTTAAMAYASHAVAALEALQDFYDPSTGLWNTCGWWNAANCMTVVADLAAADTTSTTLNTAINVFAMTFTQAPLVNPVAALSKISRPGFVLTTYDKPLSRLKERTDESAGFTDAYNDDNMWWALAWIAAYDLTRNASYLDTAIGLFDYNTNYGGPSYCNGGIYWADDNSYVNAIANELYLSAAAHIATRVDAASSAKYISIAQQQWQWFEASGMINAGYTINDGLTTSCENNNGTVWSYNQGVILGALVELNRAAPNATYLKIANKIALAAIAALTDSRNILHDPCEPSCGADGAQFKGVFMRNLRALHAVSPHSKYAQVIKASANSIWSFDRDFENQFSVDWAGPFVGTADCSTQSSAMDALVAAVYVG